MRISCRANSRYTAVWYHTKHLPSDGFYKPLEAYNVLVFEPESYDPYSGAPWDQEVYDDFEEYGFKDFEELQRVVGSRYNNVKFIKYPEEVE